MFGQSNNALQDTELSEAMVNFATAAAVDRATVANLLANINRLSTEIAIASAPLVIALATNATLTLSLASSGGRGLGGWGRRYRGGAGGEPNLRSRVGGPTGRFYCWSCGDFCYHSGGRCCSKKPGHKDKATIDNKMNGSTHSFATVVVA